MRNAVTDPRPRRPVRSLLQFSIADEIDRYVEANASIHPVDHKFHPSSVSGCQRKAVYTVRGVEPSDPPSPGQMRVFFIGSRFHEITQAAVKASPLVAEVYTEVRVDIPELNVTGAADQLVIFTDGTAEMEEYKSIKEGFKNRSGGGYGFKALTEPKADHLEQARIYMLGLRRHGGISNDGTIIPPLGDRLKRVRFTYIEKQTFDTKEYVVEWDPAWEQEITAKLNELEQFRGDNASLPPRMPDKDSFPCSWRTGRCEYFSKCWEIDGEGTPPSPDVW